MKKIVKTHQATITSILIIMLLALTISPIISVTAEENYVVTKDWVLNDLQNPNVVFLDVRSVDDYLGLDTQASRDCHIPGAINIEWTYCYDLVLINRKTSYGRCLKPLELFRTKL